MAKLVDARDLKSLDRKVVPVRFRLRAPSISQVMLYLRLWSGAAACYTIHVMKLFNFLVCGLITAILSLPTTGVAADRPGFKVAMELFRNGKLAGETTFTFTSGDSSSWIMRSETRGTKGIARLLGVEENSFSRGDWHDGLPRPLAFERNVKAVIRYRWAAEFDWERSTVHSVHPDGETTLAIEPGVIDESTLGMVIRMGLEQGEDEWFLQVLDEDEIEQEHFKARSTEQIQTVLGCVNAHVVEKIRRAGSTRYTRTYYARDHHFVPVMIEHGKTDGDHLESRLKSLEIDGKKIARGPGCG